MAAAGMCRSRLCRVFGPVSGAALLATSSDGGASDGRRHHRNTWRAAATSRCDGPLVARGGSHVTDWGSPQKAAKLQAEYQKQDVVRQRAEIVAMLQPISGERILDIGCGPGYLVKELTEVVGGEGFIQGLDPSPAMCKMTDQRLQGVQNAAVRVGSAEELPFDDSSFDAVVFSQVLLYVPDVPKALSEARRVLRPGGRLVICDTDWDSLVVHTTDRHRFERIFGACISTFLHPHLPPQLPGFLDEAGLPLQEVRTLPMISAGRAGQDAFMTNWAFNVVPDKAKAFGLPTDLVEAWLSEQRALDRESAFFACVHRFLFLARKP